MKSGFVSIVGRPNAGKSTIINALLERKLSIVTDKAQTTRNSIKGIYDDGEYQIVFIDTPGIHKAFHSLGEFMNKEAIDAAKEVEANILVVDASKKFNAGDEFIAETLSTKIPLFVVINKIDAIDDESWPSSKVSIDNSTGVMTAVGRGSNIYVVAIIDSTENFKSDTLYYLDSENIVKFNVTKGYRSISWDNTDLSNLDNMMPDVDIVLSYPMNSDAFEVTSSDESIATITAEGKLHILKAGVVTLSAKVYATDDYFEATNDTTISISAVATTIAWEQNVVNGIESSGFITATLKDYSLNNFCSSNIFISYT